MVAVAPQPEPPTTEELLASVSDATRAIAERMADRLQVWKVEADDLYQEGLLAVLKLIRSGRWNPALGSSFKTFALMRARGAMVDYLRDRSEYSRAAFREAVAAGKMPVTRSLSAVRETIDGGVQQRYQPVDHREAPQPFTEAERFADRCRPFLAHLYPDQRRILTRLFADGMSQVAIADELGISESRASQVIQGVLVELKDAVAREGLTPADLLG